MQHLAFKSLTGLEDPHGHDVVFAPTHQNLSRLQFQRLVEDELPALGRHLSSEGIAPSMYCSHWFMTAFAYALPFDHLLRVWDVFLLEGIKVSYFRVALTIAMTLLITDISSDVYVPYYAV